MGSIYRGMCRAVIGALGSTHFQHFSLVSIDSFFSSRHMILCGITEDFLLFALQIVMGNSRRGVMQFQRVPSPSAAFRGWKRFDAFGVDGQ